MRDSSGIALNSHGSFYDASAAVATECPVSTATITYANLPFFLSRCRQLHASFHIKTHSIIAGNLPRR